MKPRRLFLLSGFCSGLLASAAACQQPVAVRHPLLLVANQTDGTVSEVDPTSNRVIATIKEAIPAMFGHEIAGSADGRLAYLPLYSDVGIDGTGVNGDRLLVLDLPNAQVLKTISFGRGVRPHDPVLDPATGLLYVTTELDHAVAVIDTKSNAVIGSIPTGANQTHMLVLSHDGRFGYTANVSSGSVSVLDLRGRKLVQTIAVAPVIQRISISPDDQTVVTSDQRAPRLALIDTRVKVVRDWVPLPSVSYGTAFTRDGKWLLATLLQAGQLVAIDPSTKAIMHTIPIGTKPQEVLVRPDGAVAYVSCLGSGDVAVVDLHTWQVTARIATGPKADGMAWIP